MLDAAGYCTGCLRTGDEIASWASLGAEAQWQLIAVLERRRNEPRGKAGESNDG